MTAQLLTKSMLLLWKYLPGIVMNLLQIKDYELVWVTHCYREYTIAHITEFASLKGKLK